MKGYSKYKDSGVEWLGEIPEHWEVKRIKRLSKKVIDGTHFTPNYVNNGVPFLRVTDIHSSQIDMNNIKYISQEEYEQLNKRCNPEKGDVLLSKNGTIGVTKVVDWDFPFSIFVSLCLIKLIKEYINSYFFSYVFQGKLIDEQISESSKTTSVTNLHLDKIKNLIIVVPPIEEQKQIAYFLDHKLEQINHFISNKQRLIELLKEQKTAIINRAVTKGINPHAPMKPSGIEWLGEIPEHWEVISLKKKWSVIDCKHKTVPFVDEGVPVASIAEVKQININLSTAKKTTYEEYLHLIDGNRKPHKGDIIYSRNATVGEAAFVDTDINFCMGQDVCLIRSYTENQKFLVYELRSKTVLSQLEVLMIGSTFKRINVSDIKNLLICCPPLEEQNKIVEFIESKSEKIDLAITKIEKQIELIKEYRTTLISNAVTGKIDVRETN